MPLKFFILTSKLEPIGKSNVLLFSQFRVFNGCVLLGGLFIYDIFWVFGTNGNDKFFSQESFCISLPFQL